jgi:ssDNA-binding Zn-finger/Zn-ribbon topoisomerase 1
MVPPIEPALPVEEEKPVEPGEPVKMKKVAEKATCPDCGKNMSAKTLKYNHQFVCKSKKAESEPVNATVNIPEALIEEEVQKRIKNNRQAKLEARQQKFDKLLVEAF